MIILLTNIPGVTTFSGSVCIGSIIFFTCTIDCFAAIHITGLKFLAVLLNVKVLKEEEENVSIGNHIVDLKSYTVINQKNKEELALSKKEIELIRLFKDKEGQVISRTEILDKVWGKDQFPTTRTIDNYILHFRKS